VEETAFQNVAVEMKKFKLFFNNYFHEKSFRNHAYMKSRRVIRICILGVVLFCILAFILDRIAYQYEGDVFLWRSIIRGVIQLPVAIGWFIFTFRKERFRGTGDIIHSAVDDWYQQRRCFLFKMDYWIVGCFSASVIIVCMLLQTILSHEPDHGIYMLYSFMLYLFVGLPFFISFIITWCTYLAFLVSLYIISATDGAEGINQTNSNQSFLLSAVYLGLTDVLLTIAAYSLERGERREFVSEMELNHQQKIIEGLLNNLLPVHVTERMRNVSNNDYMIAEQVQECTILFSDLVSFTKWASTQAADVLIQRLHELYGIFDDLVYQHRVYKVETIGDAYFVSSNCPILARDHADRCVRLGKDMMIKCRELNWAGYKPQMRIGIHTGPVMAGVVGRKMPRYHLFGGTVLIAEELESSGTPDMLHISEYTKKSMMSDLSEWKLSDNGVKEVLHGTMKFNTFLVDLTEFLRDIEGVEESTEL